MKLSNLSRARVLRCSIGFLALSAGFLSCQVTNAADPKSSPTPDPRKTGQLEGYATWYPVAARSRTKSRALAGELTAAHPRLPFGTKLRVTHLGNHKTVEVRVIDRLATKRGPVIDLCKEAAEKLGMVAEGRARVRLEILAEPPKTAAKK